jgi:hypothetical protein
VLCALANPENKPKHNRHTASHLNLEINSADMSEALLWIREPS